MPWPWGPWVLATAVVFLGIDVETGCVYCASEMHHHKSFGKKSVCVCKGLVLCCFSISADCSCTTAAAAKQPLLL